MKSKNNLIRSSVVLIFLIAINYSLIFNLKFLNQFKHELEYLGLELINSFNDSVMKFIFQTSTNAIYDDKLNQYDVDSIHLELKVDYQRKIVFGKEKLTFRFIDSSENTLSKIKYNYLVLHCGRNLNIQSIKDLDGEYLMFFNKGEYLFIKINLDDSSLSQTILIEYNFRAKADAVQKGFTFDENHNHFYTLSEPYFGRYWYITKEIPSDKFIFSSDIILPDTLMAVSNGLLIDSTSLGDGYKKFSYKSKYPIAHYLVFVAGGNYKVFEHDYHYQHKNKKLKFQHFLFSNTYDNRKDELKLLENIHQRLFRFFGEYPFIDEVYGVVEVSWPFGGMEHQTRSAITTNAFQGLYSNIALQAHEYAHHWFGNYVTCKSFDDIWLNEGFATLAEELAFLEKGEIEDFLTLDDHDYFNDRVYKPQGFIFSRTVYDKGAWILKMLMHEVGTKKFFEILQTYLDRYKYSSASTEDFIEIVNQVTGKNYNWFFDQWLNSRVDRPNFVLEFNSYKKNKNYICIVRLRQIQPKDFFKVKVLMTYLFEDGTTKENEVELISRDMIFIFESDAKMIDINFDRTNKTLKTFNIKHNNNLIFN